MILMSFSVVESFNYKKNPAFFEITTTRLI